MKILLDTNVLYLLAGIQKNQEIDLLKLKTIIKNKVCYISFYTYFEILNSLFSFSEKTTVIEYIDKNKVLVNYTGNIVHDIKNIITPLYKNETYYNKIKFILGTEVIQGISDNMVFFIKSYAYATATLYIDKYENGLSDAKKYYRKHFAIIQKKIDKYILKIIKEKLAMLLRQNKLNAESIQNLLITVIANIMTYYYHWLKKTKILFESANKAAYFKVIDIFKSIYKKIITDNLDYKVDIDFQFLSICKLMIKQFGTGIDGYPPIKESKIKEYLKSQIINSIYFKNKNMENEFEKKWLIRNINSLLVESAKIKPNDFIDYEILRELYYSNELDAIITFDKPMINIMKDVPSFEKFNISNKMIKEIKQN